jgi:hypothetical protein
MAILQLNKRILFTVASIFVGILIFAAAYQKTAWDRPFFIGEYDEVYTVDTAINVFYCHGDPHEYLYGGVSVYPQSFIFLIYEIFTGKKPFYRGAFERPLHCFPYMRRVYPVEPIYIGRMLVLALYACFIVLSFWFIARLSKSYLVAGLGAFLLYQDQMLQHFSIVIKPEIYSALFTALCFLTFVAIVRERKEKYFTWQSIFCGLAIGAKLTCLSLISLSFISCYALIRVRHDFIPAFKRLILKGLGITMGVFLITNLGIIISPHHYFKSLFNESHRASFGFDLLKGNFHWLLEWFQSVHSTFLNLHINTICLLILSLVALIWYISKERMILLGAVVFLSLNIMQNLNMLQLYSRHFVHLNAVLYFLILLPLGEILNIICHKLENNKFKFFNVNLLEKILFFFLLIFFCVNTGLLKNINTSSKFEVLSDSRITLLDYIKSNPSKKFAMFNYHYYSMPEEFSTLKNVLYFENIDGLNKIVREKAAQYLIYFQEKADHSASNAVHTHQLAMKSFENYSLFLEIKGNDNNIFGDLAPQTNPTVVIRKL